MRIGHGYDVHRLKEGRPCILCGVEIPSSFGPEGHSDADVAAHALMDALLGAAALGDIGIHFPPSDDTYKDVSSMSLLKKVMDMISQKGYSIVNCDITIIAQKPKIGPYYNDMRLRLSEVMGIPSDSISIKATTEEGLGFTGSLEGIASHAVVLID